MCKILLRVNERTNWNELQQGHEKFSVSVASLISDRFRELGCKNSSLRHTHAVGLNATATTKILQRSFCWSSFQFCLIYVMAPHATRAYNLPVIQLFVARADLRCKTLNVVETFLSGSRISDWDKCSARAHIAWETMILHRPKRSVECSDSEKNMSAFADQNHAPSLTCVRLEYWKNEDVNRHMQRDVS